LATARPTDSAASQAAGPRDGGTQKPFEAPHSPPLASGANPTMVAGSGTRSTPVRPFTRMWLVHSLQLAPSCAVRYILFGAEGEEVEGTAPRRGPGGIDAHSAKKRKGMIGAESTAKVFGCLVGDAVRRRGRTVVECDLGIRNMNHLPGGMGAGHKPVADVVFRAAL
jgi:hypothetical protein